MLLLSGSVGCNPVHPVHGELVEPFDKMLSNLPPHPWGRDQGRGGKTISLISGCNAADRLSI